MLSEMLQSVEGMEIFQISGLVFFFVFFIGVVIWTMRQDKRLFDRMSNLPLGEVMNKDSHGDLKND